MAAIFPIPFDIDHDIDHDTDQGRAGRRRPRTTVPARRPGYRPSPRSSGARAGIGSATRTGHRAVRASHHRPAAVAGFTHAERVRLGLVAAVLAVVVVFGTAVVFAVVDAASQPPALVPAAVPLETGPSGAAGSSVVVVQSGDTLTSIARKLQPSGDIGGLVDRLAALHGPAPLQPGERLDVGSLGLTPSASHTVGSPTR